MLSCWLINAFIIFTMARVNRKPLNSNHGRRLLLTVVEQRAERHHARPYASIPISNDVRNGFQDISYRAFANAINRCASWIEQHIGLSTEFKSLAYIGLNDLRYQILCLAAVKTGHVVSTVVLLS